MWQAKKLIALSLLACVALSGCGNSDSDKVKKGKVYLKEEKKDKKEGKKDVYDTCTVEKKNFADEVTESAEVEYTNQDAIYFEAGNGTVESIKIEEGDKLKKGQVIATFSADVDTSDLERQKLELEGRRKSFNAELKRKQLAVQETKRQLDRTPKGPDKTIKSIEYKRQVKDLEQFKGTEKDLRDAEKTYRKLASEEGVKKIKAPFSGTVTSMGDASEGDEIESGTLLCNVQKSGDFIIKAENSQGALRYNMTVDVWLGGDRNDIRYKFKGKIASSDNLISGSGSGDSGADSGSSGAYVKISKADKKKYNFDENNVYIHYEVKHIENALLVDNEAVYTELAGEREKNFVYKVENGKLHKRYVVATFSNNKKTVISQGVEEGWELAKDVVEEDESTGGSGEGGAEKNGPSKPEDAMNPKPEAWE